MKNLVILLATAICALSSVTFAESARSMDVLETLPGARTHKTVIADATTTAAPHQVVTTTHTTTKKTVKRTQHHTKKKPHHCSNKHKHS